MLRAQNAYRTTDLKNFGDSGQLHFLHVYIECSTTLKIIEFAKSLSKINLNFDHYGIYVKFRNYSLCL